MKRGVVLELWLVREKAREMRFLGRSSFSLIGQRSAFLIVCEVSDRRSYFLGASIGISLIINASNSSPASSMAFTSSGVISVSVTSADSLMTVT